MTNFDQNRIYDPQSGTQKQQYVALVEQLDLMIRARYPLLYVIAVEEEPVEEVLWQVATSGQQGQEVLFWDIVRGWSDNGADKGSVMAALLRIAKVDAQESVLFVLLNESAD